MDAINEAIRSCNRTKLEELLAEKESIKKATFHKAPLLCTAIKSGYLTLVVVPMLLKYGANIDAFDRSGKNALMLCANRFTSEMMRLLQFLLENGAKVDAKNRHNHTALSVAVIKRNHEAAEILLKYGADPNARVKDKHLGFFCSYIEVIISEEARRETSDTRMLNVFLDNKANVNAVNEHHQTPLHFALMYGEDYVDFLMAHGASVNACDDKKRTPLHYAVSSRSENAEYLVKILLECGALVNACDDIKRTPLHYAVSSGSKDAEYIVKSLLECGALVNACDDQNWTPLHCAGRPCGDIVKILVEHGASVNACADDNQTPLHRLSNSADVHGVEILIEHGAILTACDHNGSTPLTLSVAAILVDRSAILGNRSATDVASLLVRHGTIVKGLEFKQLIPFFHSFQEVTNMLSVFLQAGLNPKIVYEELEKIFHSHFQDENEANAIQSLMEQCQSALSLQWLCRIAVRQEIIMYRDGSSIHKYIRKLPLPPLLMDFLAMLN